MRVHRVVVALMLAGLLVGMVAGCGTKVTKSNFDKIKVDMTRAEVESVLGKPDSETSGGGALSAITGSAAACVWKDGDKTITVTFVDDKVKTYMSVGL